MFSVNDGNSKFIFVYLKFEVGYARALPVLRPGNLAAMDHDYIAPLDAAIS